MKLIDGILDSILQDASMILQTSQDIRNHTGRHGSAYSPEEMEESIKFLMYQADVLHYRIGLAKESEYNA